VETGGGGLDSDDELGEDGVGEEGAEDGEEMEIKGEDLIVRRLRRLLMRYSFTQRACFVSGSRREESSTALTLMTRS
jgi:hypothetical protein